MTAESEFAISAARSAGEIVMRYFREGVACEKKEDTSPVTAADRDAEQLIRSAICDRFPNDGIVGEELGTTESSSGRVWMIDPIDGTRSFVHGVPLFSILIGLAVGGESDIGVAYFPATGELFDAAKGRGARRNGEPIRVNDVAAIEDALIVCGSVSSFVRTDRLDGFLRLCAEANSIRHWGDAYGHCMVASGRAGVMLDPIVRDWDTCAISCIVKEAGGRATDFSGVDSFMGGEMVSSNGALHPKVLEYFRV